MDNTVKSVNRNYPNAELTKQLINKVTSTKKIAVGSVAPNFKAIDGKGRIFDVQDFGGQCMVVDFWASWCEPCL